MPTISVNKADLFEFLGRDFTVEEFDELCFDFGIELDEDTSRTKRPIIDGVEEPPQLKIEIPANRYDMLCFEGIALNLNVFLGRQTPPIFQLVAPSHSGLQILKVQEETLKVRPLISCSILRNIKFTQKSYDSFISLQDKLHQNLARQRSLVSIGSHDLDTVQGPFSYEARPPEEIQFVPLNQTTKMNGKELMDFYEKDKHICRYLHLIRESPVYPVIYDANRRILSLPPIINSDHSKISLDTRNVFIDITATDKTKLEIVNQILVTMFSCYCEDPFTIEPVNIISPHNHESRITPDLSPREIKADVSYLNDVCGLEQSPEQLCELLKKMCYDSTPSETDTGIILDIKVPPTRADVLHKCDIMEDVAIAYGFNKLPRIYPNKSAAVAAPLMINKLGDIVRFEAAMAGWLEVMPLILCSHKENFAWLNREDDGKTAVRLQNPKSEEYQIVRTSLLPGLLKTIRENRRHSVPIKVFEVSDVVFKDLSLERKSRNERHFAAAWYGKTSGFEVLHGLLDRVMLMLKSNFIAKEEGMAKNDVEGYWIEEIKDPTFLVGHATSINLKLDDKHSVIGTFGILHPTVLKSYDLSYPVSALELNLEKFL